MQLKIIIVPTLVILALILAIGFIKPDYDTLSQKRALLVEKQGEVARIETVKTNIATLTSQLESKSDLEQWSLRYYPEAMDQERIIDSFNFMALQSGLVIKSMEMKEIIVEKKETFDVGGPLTSIPGATPDPDMPLVPSYQPPTPNSYVAQVRAKGSYENLKNFMDRLSRMDRMNTLRLMSIGTDTENKETTEETVAATDQLVGTFEARFDHVQNPQEQNALNIPVFEQATLATDGLEKAKARATSAVPVLNVDQSGRANPFQ
jgi:Tfp pilus assembly protein PilO